MLAEFFERLRDEARTNNVPFIDYGESLPGKSVVCHEGTVEIDDLPPPDRAHGLAGLADVVRVCEDEAVAPAPEIHVAATRVCLLLDRTKRDQVATMHFTISSYLEALVSLATGRPLSIDDAVKALRYNLRGAGGQAVASRLSRLDFVRKSDGARVQEHGTESLGKSVEATVQQVGEIPEEVTFSFPLYTNPQTRPLSTVDLQVSLYINPRDEAVEFRLIGDSLANEIAAVHGRIDEWLEKHLPNVPRFGSLVNGGPPLVFPGI